MLPRKGRPLALKSSLEKKKIIITNGTTSSLEKKKNKRPNIWLPRCGPPKYTSSE